MFLDCDCTSLTVVKFHYKDQFFTLDKDMCNFMLLPV